MNSSVTKKLLLVIAIVLVALALYFYSKSYVPKYRWNENYRYNNDQPYGLKLVYDLLSKTRSKNDFILIDQAPKYFLNKSDSSGLYIFMGANFITDSIGSEALLDFVKKGNNVLISSINSHHSLFRTFTNRQYPLISCQYIADSTLRLVFNDIQKDSVFKFNYKYQKKLARYEWLGIENSFFSDTLSNFGFEKISHLKYGLVDCFRVKWGKGWFIFHFNPILFSNYNMSKEEGLNYINKLFSGYNKQKIYWDEFSKSPLQSDFSNPSHESPLRFILSERSLRWSWYLLCCFILIFIIFNSKRKQAYIPLIPFNRNTTVEYINSIASLHYQNNSIVFLADEILKLFLSFVRHKYGISPNLDKKEMAKILASRSGISEETIRTLFKRHAEVKYSPVLETKDMIEFYRLTEYFYQNCK